ncbi:TetR/AcrR family transcriptional regulator [Spirillospora sp. NPDC048911]|uniref:TetR/AcrR family transcriptional regulator n=1 Tax=Spirillospora sp. NPDC048911 TaxID=3364527 RepID=UPI00371CF103
MAERPTSVWTRPQKARREQPTLTRDQIVAAALELLDAEGLDRLSMRRLGTKLNAGATTVYWHVTNKDELLELALDHVMAEVRTPDAAEHGWRMAVTGYAASLRTMIHRHPWTVPLFGSRPMLGPNAARAMDELLGACGQAGFTAYDLEYAQSVVNDYVIGAAGSEASWRAAQPEFSTGDWMAAMGPYLETTAERHPRLATHLREVWAKESRDVMEGRFTFGLGCLLDGLEARSKGLAGDRAEGLAGDGAKDRAPGAG